MADIRNIKILGTVEASTNSSIILTGSNTLIKKVLDDGTVLFEVNDSQVVVSGSIMLSGSGEFNNVSRTNDGMYSIDTALHAIDQAIEDKGAEIRNAYEAVRFRHFGTLGPYGLTRLNLTQLATSGSQYFASGNLKDITIDLLIDSNGDGIYRNDMASILLFASGSNLYADIDAPSAAGNPFRFIAVNETLLDVINTSASYNAPSSGGGVTAQEISSSFVQISNINDSLAGYATLSGVSASFATPAQITSSLTSSNIANFTNDVRSKFTAGTNITITNGVIDAASTGITSTQVTSALTPYATLSGVSGTFLKSSDASSTYATTAQVSTTVASALTPYATLSGVSSSFVNTNSTQTIVGAKTFSGGASFGTSISMAGFNSTANSTVQGALSINGNTILGSTGDSQVTFWGNQVNFQSNTLDFESGKLLINKILNTVSSSGKFVGRFDGNGSLLTNVTASYVATGSVIATFTSDVRNQFSAGTNITLTNGVIDAAGAVSPTQVTSALTPYATLTGVSSSFLLSNTTNFANAITSSGAVLGYVGSRNLILGDGKVTNGSDNVFLGYAGRQNTVGAGNIFGGVSAGDSNKAGSYNIGLGMNSLLSNISGNYNIAIGANTLRGLNSSFSNNYNIAIGDGAGYAFVGNYSTDLNNIFLGYQAGSSLTHLYGGIVIGNDNGAEINNLSGAIIIANGLGNRLMKGLRTAAGKINSTFNGTMTADNFTASAGGIAFTDGTSITSSNAFVNNSILSTYVANSQFSSSITNYLNNTALSTSINQNSDYNTAIGKAALITQSNNVIGPSGVGNVAVGVSSSNKMNTGYENVSIGVNSLQISTRGNRNIAVGANTLYFLTTGSSNIAIGYNSLRGTNLNSNIAIGYNAGFSMDNSSNCVIIGGNSGADISNTTGSVIISDGGGTIKLTANDSGLVSIPGSLTVSGNVILGNATSDSITLNAATMSLGSGTGILNIDSNTFYVDGNNNRIGIGKTSPISTLDISGSVTVTGSVNVSTTLKLSAQNPLPAGTVGMMAVSGTNLYFHNGTAWTMVI